MSGAGERARGPRRWVLVGLGPPALAALILLRLRPADGSPSLALGLVLALAVLALVARRSRGAGARRALVAAVALLVLPAWGEVGLRVASWSFDPGLRLRFGFPDPVRMLELDHDPELFWKQPHDRFGVNALGFIGPEPELPKPAGRTRLVFLGDSCTESGFPALVGEELGAGGAGLDVDTVNLATAGYSSYQGRVLAERWLQRLEPDFVAVDFGWNDHWLAWGSTDEERARRARGWRRHLAGSRLWQALAALPPAPRSPLAVPRVSPAEYRANLARIGAEAEAAGARVLLLTAPSSHAELGVPDMFVVEHFGPDAGTIVRWHAEYNDVVRELARAKGWTLVDLAAEAPHHERFVELLTEDGVHLTWRGMRWVAERVARAVADLASPPGLRSWR